MLFFTILFSLLIILIKGNNFPSLLTTNATLAIIVDREYLGEKYESVKTYIDNYVVYGKREILKHGGLNVQFYSWTSINIKRDITAILAISSCIDLWKLYRSAIEENLLLMAISESICSRMPNDEAITIPLLQPGEELTQILLDLRCSKIFQWKSVVVLHDITLNRDLINEIIKAFTLADDDILEKATAISLIKLNTTGSIQTIRKSLQNTISQISPRVVGNNFLVAVASNLVEIIMEYAKMYKLVNIKSQWLYVISDIDKNRLREPEDYNIFLHEGDNIAFIYNSTISSGHCKTGLQCHTEEVLGGFFKALDKAIQEEYRTAGQVFDEEWEAIRPTKLERRDFLLEMTKKYIEEKGTCDNCTKWTMKTGETWGMEYEQNKLNKTIKLKIIPAGIWQPSKGALMTDGLFPHITYGFRRKVLPLVSFHNPPFQIITQNETGHIHFSGLVFDILNELSNNLNFTYTVKILNIDKTSNKNKNDSLNNDLINFGNVPVKTVPSIIIDMLHKKTIAFVAAGFSITESNRIYVNFTIPISTLTYSFIVARPRELSRTLLFKSPFATNTWFCLIGFIIAMGPILYFVNFYSPFYEYNGIVKKGGLSSLQNCIWYMYGALLQQGGMHLPKTDSARIVVGAWWLVVLIISTTYCGNLVAYLTFPKVDIPITTINELLSHSDTITWSFPKQSLLDDILKNETKGKFRKLYKERSKEDLNNNLMKKIIDGKHVYIDWKLKLKFIMKKQFLETDRCDLVLSIEDFFDEQIGIVTSQDSPYIPIINDEIKKIYQVGLIEKWLRDYSPKRDKCWKNRNIIEVNNHTVNLDDMQGSFFVLFLGFFIGFLFICGENFLFKYKKKHRGNRVIQPFVR